MNKNPKVLILCGSIRSSSANDSILLNIAKDVSTVEDYISAIEPLVCRPGKERPAISNTEIVAGAALLGAKEYGADIDYFSIKKIFPHFDRPLSMTHPTELGLDDDVEFTDWLGINGDNKREMIKRIKAADGIILASPVYFGDRSSVANKFMQFALQENLLAEKVFGSVTVGAKRNGGQETTNAYVLYEAINLGAYIVGNGPPTSQYGGTVVAGDLGTGQKDSWGLETCFGTGQRVSQVAEIISTVPQDYGECPTKILVLNCMDTPDRRLSKKVDQYIEKIQGRFTNVGFKKIDLINYNIYRCLGCNICPLPDLLKKSEDSPHDTYACIFQNNDDQMNELREHVLDSDGIILGGVNFADMRSVLYRYQAFTERTRFIRHNNFELTNVPMAGLLLNEVGARNNPIFDLKVMTAYLRHNGIILKSIIEHQHNGNVIVDGTGQVADFVGKVQRIKASRNNSSGMIVSYAAGGHGGYSNTALDSTFSVRK